MTALSTASSRMRTPWCFSSIAVSPRIIAAATSSLGFLDLDDLKPPGQGGIFLEVLFVLGPGRGGDRSQLAARQGGLEQVGRVALSGCSAGPDHRVGLVDEQNDRHGRRS